MYLIPFVVSVLYFTDFVPSEIANIQYGVHKFSKNLESISKF